MSKTIRAPRGCPAKCCAPRASNGPSWSAAGGLQWELPGMILQLRAKHQSKDTGVRDDGAQMSTMRDDWIWGNWWAVRLSGP